MNDKLAAAFALLDSIRKNLPPGLRVPAKYVREYHSALGDLERASGENLAAYRVPAGELSQDVKAYRLGRSTRYSEPRCDRAFLLAKLDALLSYFEFREQPAKAPIGFRPPK